MSRYLQKVEKLLSSEPDPAFARRAKYIFKNLDISGKEKILDLGCGRGFYLKTLLELWPDLKLYGVDQNKKYLDIAKRVLSTKVNLTRSSATKLPFKDESFERVIASEVLEHIKNDKKAISEISRILKPGGRVIITVPNKNYPFFWDPINWTFEIFFNKHIPKNIWWLAGIWADHFRLYSVKGLKNKLKEVGFQIIATRKLTGYCFPFSHFLLYGVGKNVVETGLLKSFNRFEKRNSQSLLNKLALYPFKLVDKINEGKNDFKSSVNIVVYAKKI